MTITRSFLTHPGPDHPPKRISTSFPLTSARRWWPYIKQSVPSFLYSGTNRSNVSSGGLMLIFQVPNGFLQQQRQGSFDTLCTNGKTPQDCQPPQLTDPCPRARLSHAAFRVKAPQCLWSLSAWNNSSQPELSHLRRIKYPLHRHFKRFSGSRVSQHEHELQRLSGLVAVTSTLISQALHTPTSISRVSSCKDCDQ